MGGGTPLIEANRLGCDIVGYDINPMAYWIVRQEIEHLDVDVYSQSASCLRIWLEQQVGSLYRTNCNACGAIDADVKYFIWVKQHSCVECRYVYDLFPGYLLAEDKRHLKNVIICSRCGGLNEVIDRKNLSTCSSCGVQLVLKGPASRNRCLCPNCGAYNTYPNSSSGPPRHRMVAIEYHCKTCKKHRSGRFFKKPDEKDINKYNQSTTMWHETSPRYAPNDQIPSGDETDRLHRWGYHHYQQMFNDRQLLSLELSCEYIAHLTDTPIRHALATNLSDLLRYQNMLCRYDTMALKSLDIFSVHGFPVGLVQCESNILGIINHETGMLIGSDGWANIIEKYVRAKEYCAHPFEIQYRSGKKFQVQLDGEWIGDYRNKSGQIERRIVSLNCESSTESLLPKESLDAVFTDPPYFANVQYAELMDFCYVWLRRLVTDESGAFDKRSTRDANELTGNVTMDRGIEHFTEGLSSTFANMTAALKRGRPLAFTYHHNKLEAYFPLAVAILDSGLTCSASLPCPAEMAGSIHINGSASSIVDTIFVCRSTGRVARRLIVSTADVNYSRSYSVSCSMRC